MLLPASPQIGPSPSEIDSKAGTHNGNKEKRMKDTSLVRNDMDSQPTTTFDTELRGAITERGMRCCLPLSFEKSQNVFLFLREPAKGLKKSFLPVEIGCSKSKWCSHRHVLFGERLARQPGTWLSNIHTDTFSGAPGP